MQKWSQKIPSKNKEK